MTVVSNYSFSSYIEEMRQYAISNDVPIIKDEGLAYLVENIKKYNVKSILEIGSAIGYSASVMANCNNAMVTTIERDPKMYEQATKNIKNLGLENQINIVFKDALEAFDLVKDKTYDMVFIDAAKGQYKKFFQMYSRLLNPNGIIVCDNMDFHGLTEADPKTLTRGVRGLVTKLNAFRGFLFDNPLYETDYSPIGDGMTVSVRIKPDLIDLEDKFSNKEMHSFYDKYFDDVQSDKYCNNYYHCYGDLTKEFVEEKILEAKSNNKEFVRFVCSNKVDNLNESSYEQEVRMIANINDIVIPTYNKDVRIVEDYSKYEQFLFESYKVYGESFAVGNAKRYISLAKENKVFAYAIYENEEIIGGLNVYINNESAKLEDFYVLSDYRMNHNGSALFNYAINDLKNKNVKYLALDADNLDTCKDIYSKWGFKNLDLINIYHFDLRGE